MFSLKKLFGSKDEFIPLLAAMASQARLSATAVCDLIRGGSQEPALQTLRESRVRERELAAKALDLICKEQKVPFGRDDMDDLNRSVQAIPRAIRKFAERYSISARRIGSVDFNRELAMLESATATVQTLISNLERGPAVATTKTHNDSLQKVEGDVDTMVLDSIVRLYHETQDPIRALMLKDLYELLDRAVDRCRTTGNLILRIAMKHS